MPSFSSRDPTPFEEKQPHKIILLPCLIFCLNSLSRDPLQHGCEHRNLFSYRKSRWTTHRSKALYPDLLHYKLSAFGSCQTFFYILRMQQRFILRQVTCQYILNQNASNSTIADLSVHIWTYFPTAQTFFQRSFYFCAADITICSPNNFPFAPVISHFCTDSFIPFIPRYVFLDTRFIPSVFVSCATGSPTHFEFEWLLYLSCSP